jgi:hypothetical protein
MEGSGSGLVSCDICGREYKAKGIARHRKVCEKEKDEREARHQYLRQKKEKAGGSTSKVTSKASISKPILPWEVRRSFHSNQSDVAQDVVCTTVPTEQLPVPSAPSSPAVSARPSSNLNIPIDSIKTEYHPHSARPHRIEKFEDYKERDTTNIPLPSTDPWRPFQSKVDFEFAEIVLEACLSKNQAEKLISIVQRCQTGDEQLNIGSHKQLCETWDQASSLLTPVQNFALVLPLYTKLNLYHDL